MSAPFEAPGVGPDEVPTDRLGARPTPERPVVLEARLVPELSRWLWLVKWFLAIPHLVVLVFLWLALFVLTVVAGISILVSGRYPRAIFDFDVGVLRWTWRVSHYAFNGGLGTDAYPPFTLRELPEDDARFDVLYPERLSRPLVLVKWLLLLPHWIVVALLAGTQSRTNEDGLQVGGWPGVIGLLCLVAAVILLVTGTYARGLFEAIVGLNRWVYRVTAYAALMTDQYPPFRYDGGGAEPAPRPPAPAPSAPAAPWTAPPPPPPPPSTGPGHIGSEATS